MTGTYIILGGIASLAALYLIFRPPSAAVMEAVRREQDKFSRVSTEQVIKRARSYGISVEGKSKDEMIDEIIEYEADSLHR